MLKLHPVRSALCAATVALLLPLLPAQTEAAATCQGQPVTNGCKVNGSVGPCKGTSGNDVIVGTPGPDVIHARGGHDRVLGRGGRDTICGGGGEDLVFGGGGADSIEGNGGDDDLRGEGGGDTIDGGGGSGDVVNGGNGNDTCTDPGFATFWACEIFDGDGDGFPSSTDCDEAEPDVNPEATEVCNGIDDDCDGSIDEGFPLEELCSEGEGVCGVEGALICDPADPTQTVCSAEALPPSEPGTELNCEGGSDEDCDGLVDCDDPDCTADPACTALVTNLDDSGPGSLRDVLAQVVDGGTITFDPDLAGGTLTLTSGQLTIDKSVTIDASAAAPVTITAGNVSRVAEVSAGAVVAMNDLVARDGAAPTGGGILNHGALSLERVVVTQNAEVSAGPASFDLGGGGIYNGAGATLNLTDSTVSDNMAFNQTGGGIYGYFNSTINVTGSTISGNVAGDVAGGFRTLGNASVVNSTISGNTSTTWHGGAMFITDGSVAILNSTIVDNSSPPGTAALFVGNFGAPATLTLQNSIVADNPDFNCATLAAVTLTSLGNGVFTDTSCNPIASDQVVVPAGVDVLADNGGPTLTHALLAGSPAIDSADAGACPATDQRGNARPQGAGCDAGSFERAP